MTPEFKKKWPLAEYTKALAAISVIALAACSSQPPAPDWALVAESAAQKATAAYLQGQQRVEALQWQKARDAVASTGQPALAARLELMRCAAQVASLEWDNCPGYAAVAQDAAIPEQAYAHYLQAQLDTAEIVQLPEQQRAVASAIATSGAPALVNIKDPLSRLVAAGVMLRAGGATPELLQLGVDTASDQGWRRPLMAWLLLQLKSEQQAGNSEKAAQLERRLKLLQAPAAK